MCRTMLSAVVPKSLLVSVYIAGALLARSEAQFPVAWSENSTGPLLRAKMSVPPGRLDNIDDIILRFYNGSSPSEVVSLRLPDASRLLHTAGYVRDAPTVLYIHGYIELVTDESVQTVAAAYLEGKPDYNIITLDWSNMAYGSYVSTALRVKPVGLAVGRRLARLASKVSPERWHIVGHSLGAHIAGHIGRVLAAAGHKLPRISALDPAFPGFYPPLLGTALRRGDAAFVDAVHTDGGLYGTPLHTAHVDFWPNGGVGKQPGCDPVTFVFSYEDFCSHHRSWRLWAESVRVHKAFPARRCTSYKRFVRDECGGGPAGYMGHDAEPGLRGDYYLTTAANSPFALELEAS